MLSSCQIHNDLSQHANFDRMNHEIATNDNNLNDSCIYIIIYFNVNIYAQNNQFDKMNDIDKQMNKRIHRWTDR